MPYELPVYLSVTNHDWMLERADYVIAYMTHLWGGAANYTDMAQRKGNHIIRISKTEPPPISCPVYRTSL